MVVPAFMFEIVFVSILVIASNRYSVMNERCSLHRGVDSRLVPRGIGEGFPM